MKTNRCISIGGSMFKADDENCFELIQKGLVYLQSKEYSMAKLLFQQSVDLQPTPEGLTYLASMYSREEEFKLSIELCKQAILLDPSYGNPYNDIGTYLVQQHQLMESIEWFEKAKKALRYEDRNKPYLNLGRLYIRLSNVDEAKKEYESLLEFDPFNIEAQLILGDFVGKQFEKHNKYGIFSSN